MVERVEKKCGRRVSALRPFQTHDAFPRYEGVGSDCQSGLSRDVRKVQRLADGSVGQLAGMRVQTVHQVRIYLACALPALIGDVEHMGQRGIAQCNGRRTRNSARHVGHAVVHDAIHLVDGIVVGRGL